MTIRAKINSRHLFRLAAIGSFCFGLALWALYDGLVGWPNQRERALAYQELDQEDRLEEWRKYATERGWEVANPGPPKTEAAINGQFVMVGLAGVAGMWVFIHLLRSMGRWVETDGSGLKNSRGHQLQFNQITALDKKKWSNKGIAKVQYQANGRKKKFVLDDYIYERDSTDAILMMVEEKIGPEKIVNGKPESPASKSPGTAPPAGTGAM